MGHIQRPTLDRIAFENVSVFSSGQVPVLQNVDFELPMDQTIIIQSSNPTHAVFFLEVLSGRKAPQSGRIMWDDSNIFDFESQAYPQHEVVGCYFENQRPSPNQTIKNLLSLHQVSREVIADLVEHFSWDEILDRPFKSLTYETQKLLLLSLATVKNPQMLILEDPAVGISEHLFLDFLDWIQKGQRCGHMRHFFLTNNHPSAARHLEAHVMHLEDGLIYFEENQKYKKAVHF